MKLDLKSLKSIKSDLTALKSGLKPQELLKILDIPGIPEIRSKTLETPEIPEIRCTYKTRKII